MQKNHKECSKNTESFLRKEYFNSLSISKLKNLRLRHHQYYKMYNIKVFNKILKIYFIKDFYHVFRFRF